jgi:hypothetical protein
MGNSVLISSNADVELLPKAFAPTRFVIILLVQALVSFNAGTSIIMKENASKVKYFFILFFL